MMPIMADPGTPHLDLWHTTPLASISTTVCIHKHANTQAIDPFRHMLENLALNKLRGILFIKVAKSTNPIKLRKPLCPVPADAQKIRIELMFTIPPKSILWTAILGKPITPFDDTQKEPGWKSKLVNGKPLLSGPNHDTRWDCPRTGKGIPLNEGSIIVLLYHHTDDHVHDV